MTLEEKGRLLMLCGALCDVAEKSKEEYTKSQLEVIASAFIETIKNDPTVRSLTERPAYS